MDKITAIKSLFAKAKTLRSKADGFAHVDATKISDIMAEAAEYESKAMSIMSTLTDAEMIAFNA